MPEGMRVRSPPEIVAPRARSMHDDAILAALHEYWVRPHHRRRHLNDSTCILACYIPRPHYRRRHFIDDTCSVVCYLPRPHCISRHLSLFRSQHLAPKKATCQNNGGIYSEHTKKNIYQVELRVTGEHPGMGEVYSSHAWP